MFLVTQNDRDKTQLRTCSVLVLFSAQNVRGEREIQHADDFPEQKKEISGKLPVFSSPSVSVFLREGFGFMVSVQRGAPSSATHFDIKRALLLTVHEEHTTQPRAA